MARQTVDCCWARCVDRLEASFFPPSQYLSFGCIRHALFDSPRAAVYRLIVAAAQFNCVIMTKFHYSWTGLSLGSRHEDRFRLEVFFQTFETAFPSDARLFETVERYGGY